MNMHIEAQPVQNFNNSMLGVQPNTPDDALEHHASHWCLYWQCKCGDRTHPHSRKGNLCVCGALTQDLALSMFAVSASGVSFNMQSSLSSLGAVCYDKRLQPWQLFLKVLAKMWIESITSYSQKPPIEFALSSDPAEQAVGVGHSPPPRGNLGYIEIGIGMVCYFFLGDWRALLHKKLTLQFEAHAVAYQHALMHPGHSPAPNMRWPSFPILGPRQPTLQLNLLLRSLLLLKFMTLLFASIYEEH